MIVLSSIVYYRSRLGFGWFSGRMDADHRYKGQLRLRGAARGAEGVGRRDWSAARRLGDLSGQGPVNLVAGHVHHVQRRERGNWRGVLGLRADGAATHTPPGIRGLL